jgi:hypothetical protein
MKLRYQGMDPPLLSVIRLNILSIQQKLLNTNIHHFKEMAWEYPTFANRPHPPALSPKTGRRGAKLQSPSPKLGRGQSRHMPFTKLGCTQWHYRVHPHIWMNRRVHGQ